MADEGYPLFTLAHYERQLPPGKNNINVMKKLNPEFYRREDVLVIAKDLLGKILVTKKGGRLTSGRIVEVEAYAGTIDRASHAYGGRRTARTEIMYRAGGVAYVYLCYGIHHLFNVVTHGKDIPHAILVRALEPVKGVKWMLKRRAKKKADHTLARGPGNVSKALGIRISDTGRSLRSDELYIADDGCRYKVHEIALSKRIGVDYAGTDADLPYRFYVKGCLCVSGGKVGKVK